MPKLTYKKAIYVKSDNFIIKVLHLPKDNTLYAWCMIEHTLISKIKKTILTFEKGRLNVDN